MIPDQWYAILDSGEIRPGQAIGVTRLAQKLVIWRDRAGKLAALRDRCPHRGAALSIGPVQDVTGVAGGDAGGCIVCPFHGFAYDATGRCRTIPANGRTAPVPRVFQAESYPVVDAHGYICLWYHLPGEPVPAELPPVSFFEDLDASFAVSRTLRQHWPVHYSRAIENQLDVVHLPFVHAGTIGRGHKTVVDGPVARLHDGVLDLWVYNRVDDGTPARRSSEMPEPSRPFGLQFRFPNLWQNRISDDFRLVLAFVPIDDGNTLMCLRVYQRTVRLPIARQIASLAMLYSSIPILNEDRRVVRTQRPLRSELRMAEHLIPGDGPIVLYRRHRQELIEQAECAAIDRAGGQAIQDLGTAVGPHERPA